MNKPTMPTPDTTVYGPDRFAAPKHAYFHENVLALNKAWAAYHEAAIKAAVAAEREACALICDSVNNYSNPMTATDCADAIRARGAAHE